MVTRPHPELEMAPLPAEFRHEEYHNLLRDHREYRYGKVRPVYGGWTPLVDDLPWLLHAGDERVRVDELEWAQRVHYPTGEVLITVADRSSVLARGRFLNGTVRLGTTAHLGGPKATPLGTIVAHWAQPRAERVWMVRLG